MRCGIEIPDVVASWRSYEHVLLSLRCFGMVVPYLESRWDLSMFCYYWDVLGRWFPYCSLAETWRVLVHMMFCGMEILTCGLLESLAWSMCWSHHGMVMAYMYHDFVISLGEGMWFRLHVGRPGFMLGSLTLRWILVIPDLMFWAISSWICMVGWNPTGLIMIRCGCMFWDKTHAILSCDLHA